MPTTRRYTFAYDGVWAWDEGHDTVRRVLERRCEAQWRFNNPQVGGEVFKRLTFSFTVTARNQWWCHKHAMDLASACFMAMSLSPRLVPEPIWEPLPPHTNRGRFRTPKDQEPAPV